MRKTDERAELKDISSRLPSLDETIIAHSLTEKKTKKLHTHCVLS